MRYLTYSKSHPLIQYSLFFQINRLPLLLNCKTNRHAIIHNWEDEGAIINSLFYQMVEYSSEVRFGVVWPPAWVPCHWWTPWHLTSASHLSLLFEKLSSAESSQQRILCLKRTIFAFHPSVKFTPSTINYTGIDRKYFLFLSYFNSHAPLKNIELKTKKEQNKWLSKELRSLINEKHRVFNEWEKDPNQELLNSNKVLRNNVDKNYVKHLTIIQKNFSRISQFQKNNGKLFKIKLTQTNRQK